jgi:L-asparaginase
MRAPSQAGADGAANIQAAITAVLRANDSNSVMVVLDNEIHAARYVRKCHTTALDAFRSGGHGPLGRLHEGRIRWHHVVLPRLNRFVLAQPDRMPKVALVPIAFDQPPDLISALPGLGYAGCVVEAMGAGHVPAAIVPPLAALASTFPVALSTRVDDGGVCERTYAYPGSETDLLSAGLIPAGPLNALKARILLTLCLVAEGTRARTAFVEIIAAL